MVSGPAENAVCGSEFGGIRRFTRDSAKPRHGLLREPASDNRVAISLSGVSETMLWSLHNRAVETNRRDAVLSDPESVRIHNSIDYDFDAKFGDPGGSLAARAAEIDRVLRQWLKYHPDGCIVSLGEGLETQAGRVDNGRMKWRSVDLPAAINLRERFLTPTERFHHVSASVLDPVWMDAVDATGGVCIVAQGLLMYLEPHVVSRLFSGIARRFPDADMVFDTVPRWFSDLTVLGLNQTPRYRLPAMPWGINRDEIEPALRGWHPHVARVTFLDYRSPRGVPRLLADLTKHVAVVRQAVPSLVCMTTTKSMGQARVTLRRACTETSTTISPEKSDLTSNNYLTFRSSYMSLINDGVSSTGTIRGVSAMVIQNMNCGDDIATAARHVIAKRVALGIEAVLHPDRADNIEFARIVPEKLDAFSAAGKIMMQKSGEANGEIMQQMSSGVMTAARAAISMAQCSNPVDLAAAQYTFTQAWMGRAAANFIAMTMFALSAQAAVLAPIRQTVVDNSKRLAFLEPNGPHIK